MMSAPLASAIIDSEWRASHMANTVAPTMTSPMIPQTREIQLAIFPPRFSAETAG